MSYYALYKLIEETIGYGIFGILLKMFKRKFPRLISQVYLNNRSAQISGKLGLPFATEKHPPIKDNYYELLNVNKEASLEEIKKSFHELG